MAEIGSVVSKVVVRRVRDNAERRISGARTLLPWAVATLLVYRVLPYSLRIGVTEPFFVSLVPVGLITVAMILYESARFGYSLQLMHWMYVYVYFVLSPFAQYPDRFPYGIPAHKDRLVAVNLAILAWCVSWVVTRLVTERWLKNRPLGLARVSKSAILVGVFLGTVASLGYVAVMGLGHQLLWRGTNTARAVELIPVQGLRLIWQTTVRFLPVAGLALSWNLRYSGFGRLVLPLLALGTLLSNFPTAGA